MSSDEDFVETCGSEHPTPVTYPEPMKYGIAFANVGPFVGAEEGVRLARAAEGAGFESIWTVDHVVVPAGYRSTYPYDPSGRIPSGEETVFPDPLIWLSFVAARTSTIRLGTGILIVPERNPLVLAKELATIDFLSGGRMMLGAGVGWLEEEFEALGIPFAGRGHRTEESIGAMRALWSEKQATFEGTTTSFRDCCLRPQPVHGTIPVHVGGHSATAARRAGRLGDGFFPFGVTHDELPALIDLVRRSANEAGRDPDTIEISVQSILTDPEKARTEAGVLQQLGATRVVIPAAMFKVDTEESLAEFGADVIGPS
jgi:probable F420-dependent oxidoreductase